MWIITIDHLHQKDPTVFKSCVGISSTDYKPDNHRLCTEKFKLYDDDYTLYYEGLSDDSNSEKAFAPLDDFGTPDSGCTVIEYLDKKTNQYKQL